ncbi:hypothetical protein M23134_03582 [Microscilla marina ATCC 23134]|uniref:Uncharacterized protein n=1 Tax=Microscilla marina ATCC 23134 TaxID=313606 RepID=A1ZRM5_MICM2|nr:hypothetical protein M23134_03582 [Microscilla marina ATCC 23134]
MVRARVNLKSSFITFIKKNRETINKQEQAPNKLALFVLR